MALGGQYGEIDSQGQRRSEGEAAEHPKFDKALESGGGGGGGSTIVEGSDRGGNGEQWRRRCGG